MSDRYLKLEGAHSGIYSSKEEYEAGLINAEGILLERLAEVQKEIAELREGFEHLFNEDPRNLTRMGPIFGHSKMESGYYWYCHLGWQGPCDTIKEAEEKLLSYQEG